MRACVELGGDRVEVGGVGRVPEGLPVLLDEVGVSVDIDGDFLRDVGFERDPGVGSWSYQRDRSRT
jgi:hypothetical protein